MYYIPATIPDVHRDTHDAVLVLAADIVATNPHSTDAITEAANQIDWTHNHLYRRSYDTDIAAKRRRRIIDQCHTAASHTAANRHGTLHDSWIQWQAHLAEPWPILIVTATPLRGHDGVWPTITAGHWEPEHPATSAHPELNALHLHALRSDNGDPTEAVTAWRALARAALDTLHNRSR